MSAVYLRSVEFSNFRVYGDSYAYEFPAGPSVTLICGGNGLGKTSFFDGVEWALTGQVGRFSGVHVDGRRKTPDPLTRIGAPANSHRVSLQFSEGLPIDRGGGFEPHEADIAKLLKQSNWAEIADLHGYLSITHFFGQTSTQRFSLKKPNEQWEALKGPAGIDRINALRDRMSGQGVRRAFSRAIDERTKRLEAITEEIAAWRTLLEERDRAKQLASSENAVEPALLRVFAESYAGQILAIFPSLQWFPVRDHEQPELILDRLGSLVRGASGQIEKETAQVESLSQLVAAFAVSKSDAKALANQLEPTKQRYDEAVDHLKTSDAKLAELTLSLTTNEAKSGQAISRLVSLDRVFAASQQLTDALARQTAIETDIAAAASAVETIEATLLNLRKQLARCVAQRNERRALADRLTQARTLAQLSKALAVVNDETARLVETLGAKAADDPRSKRTKLEAEVAVINTEISAHMSALRQHDDRMQAISEAVVVIAHQLRPDDTSCPVCTSVFPPGRLIELAGAHAVSSTVTVTQLATALADTRLTYEALQRQIAAVDADLAEIRQIETRLAFHRSRQAELRQQVVDAGGTADVFYDDTIVTEIEQELDALDAELSESAKPEDIDVEIEAANTELKAETAKRTSLQQTLSDVFEASHAARSVLLPHPDLWTAEAGILVDFASERAAAELYSKETSEEVALSQTQVLAARASRDSFQEVMARETEALASLTSRLEVLNKSQLDRVQLWLQSGQPGEPNESALAEHRSRLAERATRIKSAEDSLQQLIAGYRKWLENEQLRRLEDEITNKMVTEGVLSEGEVTDLLASRVTEARNDITAAQNAKSRVETVGNSIQQRAGAYADEVLVPLNDTITRFARALMTWSDESISYHAEHSATRSELRPGIVKRRSDGSTAQMEMNPNLYFSEGQLAALSVAALLAASTTFGWSRWKGLLLDDPLQHNDVIHASAFMDLLRQLVNVLGYQIILSTHDSSEAEFLSRKCRSAGIPYQIHELAPRSEEGLVLTPDRLPTSTAIRGY